MSAAAAPGAAPDPAPDPAPSRARVWLLASRPATLPAAAVPVLVGTAVARAEGAELRGLVFAATLVCALLIQVGTNFANDYSDFHRGADTPERLGPTRVTQSGLLPPHAVRNGIVVAFALAVALGAYLASVGGWPIVAIGLASLVAGLAYTGGPWPFGYHGLGDLFVFTFFGVVAVMGSAYLQTGHWTAFAFHASLPIGLLVTNILVVNNLRDIDTDRAASKRTLAVRMGAGGTRAQYALFVALAYLAVLLLESPPSHLWAKHRALLLPWLTLPLAVVLARRVLGGLAGRDLNPMLRKSGQLLLLFGVLLAAGLLLTTR